MIALGRVSEDTRGMPLSPERTEDPILKPTPGKYYPV